MKIKQVLDSVGAKMNLTRKEALLRIPLAFMPILHELILVS